MKAARIDRRTLILGAAALTLAGCGGDEAGADEPPEVSYGRDLCDRCRMIISEERHAAGLVDGDGKATLFDDTGELVSVAQEQGVEGLRVWVHDYGTGEWVDGTAAFYVAGSSAMTPMATGVVAFATRAAAEEFAGGESGRVMTWAEILRDWSIGAMIP